MSFQFFTGDTWGPQIVRSHPIRVGILDYATDLFTEPKASNNPPRFFLKRHKGSFT